MLKYILLEDPHKIMTLYLLLGYFEDASDVLDLLSIEIESCYIVDSGLATPFYFPDVKHSSGFIKRPANGDFLGYLPYSVAVFTKIATSIFNYATNPDYYAPGETAFIFYNIYIKVDKPSAFDIRFDDKDPSFFFMFFFLLCTYAYFFLFLQTAILRVCIFNKKYVQIWKYDIKAATGFIFKFFNTLNLKRKALCSYVNKYV